MKLSNNFLIKTVAGENVALPITDKNISASQMYTLNDTGMFIVESLKEEMSFDKLVEMFLEQYDVDRPTAERDLTEYIEELEKIGIVYEAD